MSEFIGMKRGKKIVSKSKNISWMPLIVIAASVFVGALDATFMNVSMSQVVIDLDTDLGTIQKMVSFYTLITASLLLVSARLQDIIGKRKIFLLGIILTLSLMDIKKQKSGENEKIK